MITRIVKMEIKESDIDSYKTLVQSVIDKIKNFEGCHSVNIFNDKDIPNRFFSYSTWENEEYLNEYRESELFKTTWSELKTFFKSSAQAWTVEDAL